MSQAIAYLPSTTPQSKRFGIAADLARFIDRDGPEGAVAELEAALITQRPDTKQDAALGLLVAASWLEAAMAGGLSTEHQRQAIAAVRASALRLGARKLSLRVQEYYGAGA